MHRRESSAWENPNTGEMVWHQNGKIHREDCPQVQIQIQTLREPRNPLAA